MISNTNSGDIFFCCNFQATKNGVMIQFNCIANLQNSPWQSTNTNTFAESKCFFFVLPLHYFCQGGHFQHKNMPVLLFHTLMLSVSVVKFYVVGLIQ